MVAQEITNELELAQANVENNTLIVTEDIYLTRTLCLAPGATLQGIASDTPVTIHGTVDLIQCSSNNHIHSLNLTTLPNQRALFCTASATVSGTLTIENVTIHGLVSLIVSKSSAPIDFIIDDVFVVTADTTASSAIVMENEWLLRPAAFTLWNKNTEFPLTAIVKNIRIGSPKQPVYGSGLLLAGNPTAPLHLSTMTTNEIFSDGRLVQTDTHQIACALGILPHTFIETMSQQSIVSTTGYRDYVLLNWGHLTNWTIHDQLLSYGESAATLTNFGRIDTLLLKDDLETFGPNATGFAHLEGSIQTVEIHTITTHGDGSIGFQIAAQLGDILVKGSIETSGGVTEEIDFDDRKKQAAHAIALLPAGRIQSLKVIGAVLTYKNVSPLMIAGFIEKGLRIRGKIQQFVAHQYD